MELSIVIVNWNSSDYLRKCLRSIYDRVPSFLKEIIVVDNASYDGCEAMLLADFPAVRFIQSTSNLGFARANNLGAAQASGNLLLFLNPDTEVRAGALDTMISVFETHPHAGIAGCKLLNADQSLQISCVQSFPTILNEALDTNWLRRKFPRSRLWGTAALYDSHLAVSPVECVSGACLMIRREVFEAVGGFTTEYFMYVEDRDLCYKVHQAGYKAYYVASAEVMHFGGTSSDSRPESNFSIIMRCESLLAFMRRRGGALSSLAFRITIAAAALVRIIALGILLLVEKPLRHRVRSRRALHKSTSILRWALGIERWVHDYAPEFPDSNIHASSPATARRGCGE